MEELLKQLTERFASEKDIHTSALIARTDVLARYEGILTSVFAKVKELATFYKGEYAKSQDDYALMIKKNTSSAEEHSKKLSTINDSIEKKTAELAALENRIEGSKLIQKQLDDNNGALHLEMKQLDGTISSLRTEELTTKREVDSLKKDSLRLTEENKVAEEKLAITRQTEIESGKRLAQYEEDAKILEARKK